MKDCRWVFLEIFYCEVYDVDSPRIESIGGFPPSRSGYLLPLSSILFWFPRYVTVGRTATMISTFTVTLTWIHNNVLVMNSQLLKMFRCVCHVLTGTSCSFYDWPCYCSLLWSCRIAHGLWKWENIYIWDQCFSYITEFNFSPAFGVAYL